MMDVRVPSEIGIVRITVDRDRAEVTDIVIGYFGHGAPIIDGTITPEQHDGNAYTIAHPAEFAKHHDDFRIWTSGTRRFGGPPGQGMARQEVSYYPDRIVAAFWTGSGEPSNTRVSFWVEPHLDDHHVPELKR